MSHPPNERRVEYQGIGTKPGLRACSRLIQQAFPASLIMFGGLAAAGRLYILRIHS